MAIVDDELLLLMEFLQEEENKNPDEGKCPTCGHILPEFIEELSQRFSRRYPPVK